MAKDDATKERPRLTRDRIVATALEIVRADGVEALSMRRVATALDVGAMSLYRHVTDRDDLMRAMMDSVALNIDPPPRQPDDREEIAAIILAIHHTFRRDPWLVQVLLFEGRGSLKIMPLLERLFAALARLGCDPATSIDCYNLLLHYAYGEGLSYQTRSARQSDRESWPEDALSAYPATAATTQAAHDWAYDEFARNIRRIVSTF